MKTPLLFILAGLTAAPIANAVILDIDGGDPTDGILGEFPDYLLSDNTKDIPDASQTDGMVTLTLRDESVFQWNNSNYPFSEGYEINFHPGGWDQAGGVLPSGAGTNLNSSINFGLYYTILIESTAPININEVTLEFNRNDTGSPRRYYILDDSGNDGFDVGDVIADSANLAGVDAGTGLILSSDTADKVLSALPGTTSTTSHAYRFYISNLPNLAGNTHLFSASVDYTVVPEPAAFAALVGLGSFSFLLWQRRKQSVSGK